MLKKRRLKIFSNIITFIKKTSLVKIFLPIAGVILFLSVFMPSVILYLSGNTGKTMVSLFRSYFINITGLPVHILSPLILFFGSITGFAFSKTGIILSFSFLILWVVKFFIQDKESEKE